MGERGAKEGGRRESDKECFKVYTLRGEEGVTLETWVRCQPLLTKIGMEAMLILSTLRVSSRGTWQGGPDVLLHLLAIKPPPWPLPNFVPGGEWRRTIF